MRKLSAARLVRATYISSLLFGVILLLAGSLVDPSGVRAGSAHQTGGRVDVAEFKLPITPVSAEYYDRAISTAESDGASALVIELDTPGGLVDSMQKMVQRTLASKVPVIVYVSPQGAMCASAGIFLVYASHVAAMAPNTTIGSAEVILNAGSDTGSSTTPETGDAASERRKVTNLLVSQIRTLADERGRNPDFGENAVRQSENLPAKDALNQKVVDVVATDVNDLLKQVDGRKVKLQNETVTLNVKNATTNDVPLTLGERILLLLTDPNVAFLLISLGTLGITWEFINPGAVFPGVVGAILLLTGLLGLGTLPVNAAGIVFMGLAFVLFIADVFMPTHGILTAGGIASLVLGGILLINTGAAPGIPGVSPGAIAGVAAGLGGFFFFAVYKVVRARRLRPATGKESLVGRVAETRTALVPEGMVFVEGELWQAISADGNLPPRQLVRVVGANGLQLTVAPYAESDETNGSSTRKLDS